jgi:hypothetical protein
MTQHEQREDQPSWYGNFDECCGMYRWSAPSDAPNQGPMCAECPRRKKSNAANRNEKWETARRGRVGTRTR